MYTMTLFNSKSVTELYGVTKCSPPEVTTPRRRNVTSPDRLHARRHDHEVQLLGFDLLELDGADLRKEPLVHRKASSTSRRPTAPPCSSTPASSALKFKRPAVRTW